MPDTPPYIAVVCGGTSAEAEVSRVSGAGVAEALKTKYADVRVIEFDDRIGNRLNQQRPDAVFPVLHGPPGEDGTFQGFLDTVGIPYVGSGVAASACAMDKIIAKQIFAANGLPTAPWIILPAHETAAAARNRVLQRFGSHFVVKTSSQGSSLGVTVCTDIDQLDGILETAAVYAGRVLVEEPVAGREVTVAVLDLGEPRALPVVEIRTPSGAWYDFEHRYTPGLSDHLIPAPLPAQQYTRAQALALAAHTALGCRDLSRVDFIVPETGDPVILEVNTIPGMTPTSLFPDAARSDGIAFAELVAGLVEQALSRRPAAARRER